LTTKELKMRALRSLLTRFRHDDKGVTLVEYGVAVFIAVAVGTVALTGLRDNINAALTSAGSAMP